MSRRFGGQTGRPNSFHRPDHSGARNTVERIRLVVNPRAGAGRAGRRLPELERAVDRAFENWDIAVTQRPGHASELAAEVMDEDVQLVAAVGGDGTCHEVINGMFDGVNPRSRKIAFTTIPFGTGSDLMKSLEIPHALNEALWVAATGMSLPTDIGTATLSSPKGQVSRRFVNVAGFGVNGEIVANVNKRDKSLGGPLTFLSETVRTALRYQPADVALEWDGPDGPGSWEGALVSCFVANGAYCGGGMWVGRGGNMHDGVLDVTILPASSKAQQLLGARRLYDGHLERLPGARRVRATWIEARPRGTRSIPVDLDGEMPGFLPARFEILPRILQVRGAWLHSPLLER